jgi:hypothetical protein
MRVTDRRTPGLILLGAENIMSRKSFSLLIGSLLVASAFSVTAVADEKRDSMTLKSTSTVAALQDSTQALRQIGTGRSQRQIGTGRSQRQIGTGRSQRQIGTGRSQRQIGTGRSQRQIGTGRSQ